MAEVTQKTTTNSATPLQLPNAGVNAKKTLWTGLQAVVYESRRFSLRRNPVGAAYGADHRRQGRDPVRAAGRRGSEGLVDDGHQHRCQQVPARTAWNAGARERRAPTGWAAWPRPFATGDSTGGYFRSAEDAAVFHDELVYLLLHQYAAFNSPVWFNVGCDRLEPNSDAANWHWNPQLGRVEFSATGYKTPQCSACFINSVQDTMESILTLAKTEGMLFKWGSGTGTNLSTASRLHGKALRRRHRQRSAVLHEGLRRLCRRHQERRQDAARRQDGHPQHRPSRHRGVHRLQGRRGGQGLGADAGRLRRLDARLGGLLLDLLPERQQLRPRQRRLHERRVCATPISARARSSAAT